MTISIVDRDQLLADDLRPLAQRRLLFALSRYDSKIASLELAIRSDPDGPGGIDKSAIVSVRLRRGGQVVVTSRDSDLTRCLARVAEQAGRAVGRALERTYRFDRTTTNRPL